MTLGTLIGMVLAALAGYVLGTMRKAGRAKSARLLHGEKVTVLASTRVEDTDYVVAKASGGEVVLLHSPHFTTASGPRSGNYLIQRVMQFAIFIDA